MNSTELRRSRAHVTPPRPSQATRGRGQRARGGARPAYLTSDSAVRKGSTAMRISSSSRLNALRIEGEGHP